MLIPLSMERRCIHICNTIFDFTRVLHIFLDGYTYHIDKILYMVSEHNENGNKLHYQQNIKHFISYVSVNGIKIKMGLLQLLVSMEKYLSVINIINQIETDNEYNYMYNDLRKSTTSYYDKYFPYDDVKFLRDLIVK